MEKEFYTISYKFSFKNGDVKNISINIDSKQLTMIREETDLAPEWARLDYKQCDCCLLTIDQHPYCPIALNIEIIIDDFKDMKSTEECSVICTTPYNQIHTDAYVSDALLNLIGLAILASDCPFFRLYKHQVKFPTPFDSLESFAIGMISVGLLGEYLYQQANQIYKPFDMEEGQKLASVGNEVFTKVLSRIQNLTQNDAYKNAFVSLSAMADMLSFELEDNLESFLGLFDAWIKGTHKSLMEKQIQVASVRKS